jgi:DUF2075 family protein
MNRYFYSDHIKNFVDTSSNEILGILAKNNPFPLEQTQQKAWINQIDILKKVLVKYNGKIYFEYSIPRMGKRIDVVLLIKSIVFVIEFKVGENHFSLSARDQVYDYALDLKNFHEGSHNLLIAPIMIATEAENTFSDIILTPQNDKLLYPINTSVNLLETVIDQLIEFNSESDIDVNTWENSGYHPTPTIIEAALALYNGHSVKDISRSDASATNLSETSQTISNIINSSQKEKKKSICFVTGVPGAGKTLVGLNIANIHSDQTNDLYSVFLSGNGPLVEILREALTRDKVRNEKEKGNSMKKSEALSIVKKFIQNVHNFRDECLIDLNKPPIEHVALFDESQRAWDKQQTSNFMKRRKNISDFNISEPEFLISCLDRHQDWAVIVCLVGGGQEIFTGEAGISEWIESLNRSFPEWQIYISPHLTDSEYGTGKVMKDLATRKDVHYEENLHLSVSMRSFRAEKVSLLVKQLLDLEISKSKTTLSTVNKKYPIVITRDLSKAKEWLRNKARGTERYGIVVSSQAERLKPQSIFVKSPMNPVHWFLDEKDDVRSSYFLEDVATEFQIQGLELDWACVTWDADFRYSKNGWINKSFKGNKWMNINDKDRQNYLKNAYRVLLTRARQGMIIVVPNGDINDQTRLPEFYDSTYKYLLSIGFMAI